MTNVDTVKKSLWVAALFNFLAAYVFAVPSSLLGGLLSDFRPIRRPSTPP